MHGDLKPGNILWSSQDGVLKLIDFGLAFSVREEDVHQVQSEGEWGAGKQRDAHLPHIKSEIEKNCPNGLHAHCTFIPDC